MKHYQLHSLWLGALLALLAVTAHAGEVNAAVAANFAEPMRQIAQAFRQDTGHGVRLSPGASGKFYAQIREGAPFDALLSADMSIPQRLEQEGLAVPHSGLVYALGRLALWSATPGLVDDQGAVLRRGEFGRLALADPKLAPYGVAARQVLQNLKLWEPLQPRLITGENIAQTYQFAASGNAELAFVALSQVTRDGKPLAGSLWLPPDTLYEPIQQGAVLLTSARDRAASEALLRYLKGDKARAIIRSFGYGLP